MAIRGPRWRRWLTRTTSWCAHPTGAPGVGTTLGTRRWLPSTPGRCSRRPATAAAGGDRLPGAGAGLPGVRGDQRGAGAGVCVRAGAVRSGVHAHAANLTVANHVPVGRAAGCLATCWVGCSVGVVAGVRGRAAGLLEPFMARVGALLRQAAVVGVDETRGGPPASWRTCTWPAPSSSPTCTPAAGPLRTSTRAACCQAPSARSCGTGTRGTRTWWTRCTPGVARTACGICGPSGRPTLWGRRGRGHGRPAGVRQPGGGAARAAGAQALEGATLAQIVGWYRGAVAKGIADNQRRRTQLATDGLRLARRFGAHEAMILRFATDLTVAFTNNQSERDIRPVKVQQRASGGCWRTLQGWPTSPSCGLPVDRCQVGAGQAGRTPPAVYHWAVVPGSAVRGHTSA
jgi:transposase